MFTKSSKSKMKAKRVLLMILLRSFIHRFFTWFIPPFPIYIFSKKINKLNRGIVFFNNWIVFADFEETEVRGYTLINSCLYNCNVYNCTIINGSVGDSYLEKVNMRRVHIFDCDLENCKMHKGSVFSCKAFGTRLYTRLYDSFFHICEIKGKPQKIKNNYFDLCIIHLDPDNSNTLKDSVVVM